MIDVKVAVRAAVKFITGLYEPELLNDLLLEEIELSEDKRYWLVTLGFTRYLPTPSHPLQHLAAPRTVRSYKQIKVDANTAQVESLKIREVEHA